jgi:hypothetical protein
MKNIFIILLLIGCVIQSSAQGTLQLTPGAKIKMANNAFIVLDDMKLVNNGSFVQAIGGGTTKFTGNADVTISGLVATFDKINIAKTSAKKVTLQQNVTVLGQVNFTSGLFDLANSVLDLGTAGTLTGETETNRIFTGGIGYVQIISTLNAPSGANPGNLGVVISSAKNLGSVTIKRGHLAQTNVIGTTPGILRYYDILPANDNGLKATLRFQYFDTELNGRNETTLELFKQDKKAWTNVGYTTRNSVNNYVEKTGIVALSRWTLSTSTSALLFNTTNNIYTDAIKENAEIKNQFSVWPNPVLQSVNVSIVLINSSPVILQLYDVKGSLVFARNTKLLTGKNLINIDMHAFAAGTYKLIATWGGNNKKVMQLIKY